MDTQKKRIRELVTRLQEEYERRTQVLEFTTIVFQSYIKISQILKKNDED